MRVKFHIEQENGEVFVAQTRNGKTLKTRVAHVADARSEIKTRVSMMASFWLEVERDENSVTLEFDQAAVDKNFAALNSPRK